VTPVPKQHQASFQHQLLSEASELIQTLSTLLASMLHDSDAHAAAKANMDARHVHKLATLCGLPARQVIEDAAGQLMRLLHKAQEIAMQICPTRVTNPTGCHHRPNGIRRKRKNQMAVLKKTRQLAGRARQAKTHDTTELKTYLAELAELKAMFARHAELDNAAPAGVGGAAANAEAGVAAAAAGQPTAVPHDMETLLHDAKELAGQASESIKKFDREHRQESMRAAQNRLQHLLSTKPKAGHKMLFADGEPKPTLDAVLDPTTRKLTTDPERVKQVVAGKFAEMQRPPTGTKTGMYLPNDAPRNHPWAHGNTEPLDPFELCTDATQLDKRPWLYGYVRDESIFFSCCKSLSNGKAPGPDGISNEVLKMLPVEVKKLVHKLFVVMWATGVTPAAWKHSNTCMIYKKGAATDPVSYRPIGLANTVYKLWTRVVTYVMYEYAEEHRVISGTQAGFRKNTSTHKQLQMLVMAIEDARLTAQDMYTMQVDFSSAFNMTDHDITLQTLYDLGFPSNRCH
jgi:hypothetical protein